MLLSFIPEAVAHVKRSSQLLLLLEIYNGMHETQATNVTSDKDVLASCLASLRSLRSLSSAFTVRKVKWLNTRSVSK